jgi:hypothetical protein
MAPSSSRLARAAEELLGHDQRQHGVAQELEPLVVGAGSRGRVGERQGQQGRVPEDVGERAHAKCTGFPQGSPRRGNAS